MRKIELMAPAGNLEILKAAIDYGADAVYVGLNVFNARMNAGNLTMDDLEEGVRYARLHSSRVYLTLNTILNDYEIKEAYDVAVEAYNIGVDALIIQDLGLISRLSKEHPEIPLIASTQMNVFSVDEIQKLKESGIKRVVFPRELSIEEIRKRNKVAQNEGLETEVFAHGAVCVCASGLCLFSSMNKSGSRSGNRGLCAQPCRQEYNLYAGKTVIKSGHLLSPKDRSIVDYLTDIIESGTTSIKIEGRMRDLSYVKNTTFAYRKLIDSYYDGSLDDGLSEEILYNLLVNFNRGGKFTSQYLSGHKSPDVLSGEYVGKYGLKLGIIRSFDPNRGTITFTYNEALPMPVRNDYISIRDSRGEICSFPIGKIHEMPKALTVRGLHPDSIRKLEAGMNVYLMNHDLDVKKSDLRKTNINIKIFNEGTSIISCATVIDGINEGINATYELFGTTEFNGSPLDNDRVIAQMSKTGDTPFKVNQVLIDSDVEFKFKVSDINDLRRNLLDELADNIINESEHIAGTVFDDVWENTLNADDEVADFGDNEFNTLNNILSLNYFPAIKYAGHLSDYEGDIIAFNVYDLLVKKFRDEIVKHCQNSDSMVIIVVPDFYHDFVFAKFKEAIKSFSSELGNKFLGVVDSKFNLDNSIYEVASAKHFISAGANIYNQDSFRKALVHSEGAFLSYELQKEEVINMLNSNELELKDKYVFLLSSGKIPWMQSDFCSIGAHQIKCRSCMDNVNYTLVPTLNNGGELSSGRLNVISRAVDCSSSIFGEAKTYFDDEDLDRILPRGINLVKVNVIINDVM